MLGMGVQMGQGGWAEVVGGDRGRWRGGGPRAPVAVDVHTMAVTSTATAGVGALAEEEAAEDAAAGAMAMAVVAAEVAEEAAAVECAECPATRDTGLRRQT